MAQVLGARLVATVETGRRHPARRHVLALLAVSVVSGAATAASPLLLTRAPELLAFLAPRLSFVTLAASRTSLPTFLVIGIARLVLTDPFHYVIGRTVGAEQAGRRRWPRPVRRVAVSVRRLLARIGVAARPACCIAVLLRPNGLNLMWAGSLGLPKVLVGALDLVGTVGYLLVVHAGAQALIG